MALLQTGTHGTAVRQLQRRLQAEGFNPGAADGDFGARTEAAVRKFQAAHGLQVDGRVGRHTQSALQAERNRDSFEPAAPQRTRRTTTTPGERPYQQLVRFAQERGFTVTSTTGGHHLGRGHREGRAADIRTNDHTPAQVNEFIRQAREAGYWVNDERRGGNRAWSGPHVHLEVR